MAEEVRRESEKTQREKAAEATLTVDAEDAVREAADETEREEEETAQLVVAFPHRATAATEPRPPRSPTPTPSRRYRAKGIPGRASLLGVARHSRSAQKASHAQVSEAAMPFPPSPRLRRQDRQECGRAGMKTSSRRILTPRRRLQSPLRSVCGRHHLPRSCQSTPLSRIFHTRRRRGFGSVFRRRPRRRRVPLM